MCDIASVTVLGGGGGGGGGGQRSRCFAARKKNGDCLLVYKIIVLNSEFLESLLEFNINLVFYFIVFIRSSL